MTWTKTGQSRQIVRLARLVPVQPPAGFRLIHATGGRSDLGPLGNRPQFQRTWTDGVTVLSSGVTEFPNPNAARRFLHQMTIHWCSRASTVSTMEEIPGSVVFFVQEAESLTQSVFFIRGYREYNITFAGPPSETPGETLSTFALRAVTVAR